MDWPFGNHSPLTYGLILADPPWAFNNYSPKGWGKSPHKHYRCMSLGDIRELPVGHLAGPDCVLVMWATWPMLVDALGIMSSWGFTYKSGGCWGKRTAGGKQHFGTGYIYRSACEPWILGTIGRPAYGSRSVRNYIEAPIREHSRKPEEMRQALRRLLPDARAIELFAREASAGWDAWGNETDKFQGGVNDCDA